MPSKIPCAVIAAAHSGSGKTTVVTGLLKALSDKGLKVQACKIGPDYIDPGYHALASGRSTLNLDSWLLPPEVLKQNLIDAAQNADFIVIEGVMGLYDGGKNGVSSTAEIAKLIGAPIILVLDVKAVGESAAAIALGFIKYDPEVNIVGVILNRVGSDNHAAIIGKALAKIGVPVLGAIRRDNSLAMPERHLGLLPAAENDTANLIERLGENISRQVNLSRIVEVCRGAECEENRGGAAPTPPAGGGRAPCTLRINLLREAQTITGCRGEVPAGVKGQRPLQEFGDSVPKNNAPNIAVAKDAAFSFYYADSLAALQKLGARLVYFSPLDNELLPQEANGVIIGGGFPEVFAARLAMCDNTRNSLRAANEKGMPIYAECGGYMYLMDSLVDFDGQVYPMTGVVPGQAVMQNKLQTVGYVTAEFVQDTVLGSAGEILRGHEFHFSRESEPPADATVAFNCTRLRDGKSYGAGFARQNILASYLHINFAGALGAANKFLASCRAYKESR